MVGHEIPRPSRSGHVCRTFAVDMPLAALCMTSMTRNVCIVQCGNVNVVVSRVVECVVTIVTGVTGMTFECASCVDQSLLFLLSILFC